jgi:hypothetical protein
VSSAAVDTVDKTVDKASRNVSSDSQQDLKIAEFRRKTLRP